MGRTAQPTFPLQLEVDKSAGSDKLYVQLRDQIRRAIVQGKLRAGDKLPATRTLAQRLEVGRITVIMAYEELVREGYCCAATGKGTSVAADLPVRRPPSHGELPAASPVDRRSLMTQSARLAADYSSFKPQESWPFALMSPDYDALPGKKWSAIAARFDRSPWLHNGYFDPAGYRPLREYLADYVRRTRGIVCKPSQIIITTGAQQGLNLSTKVLLEPGSKLLMEDPCFQMHVGVSQYHKLNTVPVPVGPLGIEIESFARIAPDARGVLVTPDHQFPLGVTMPEERKKELIAWAYRNQAWIIEDDYDCELNYGSAESPALMSYDEGQGAVVYVGTFSKTIFPGQMMGYLIVPEFMAASFIGAKNIVNRHTSGIRQVILAEYMLEGHFSSHITRIKKLYARRRLAMLAAWERWMKPWGEAVVSDKGTHLTFLLRPGIDDAAFCLFLKNEVHLEARALSECYQGTSPRSGLILGYAGFSENQIEASMQRLSIAIQDFARGHRLGLEH